MNKENKDNISQDNGKKAVAGSLILIVILGFAVYGNSLGGKFIWDDEFLVQENIFIKDLSHIGKFFDRGIGAGAGEKYGFYRPLQMVTYMIDYAFWKLDVKGYHIGSIIYHILAALSLFWLVHILFDDWLISLSTALLFVVHPVHTEAVTYISGRSDSLTLLFMLLCLVFYLKTLTSGNIVSYLLALLAYVLALLSRESALILPLFILLYHYCFGKRFNLLSFMPIAGIAFIYLVVRFTFLKELQTYLTHTSTLWQRLPGFFIAIVNYIRLLFLPLGLHMEYSNRLFPLANTKAIIGIFILGGLLVYAYKKRQSNSLVSFGLFWFFLGLVPVSGLYPINAYMAEHWLYLPSIGIFLIVAKGLSVLREKKGRVLSTIPFVVLLVFYSSLTIRQNTYWNEPISFYQRTLKYAPYSEKAHYNLGNEYKANEDYQKAIALYKKTIEIDPEYIKAYNNLGLAYHSIDEKDQAEAVYLKTIEIDPEYAKPYNNLGRVYEDKGQNQKAITYYTKAIEIDPDYSTAYYNMGIAYYPLDVQKSIAAYKKATEIDPQYAKAHYNLGLVYYKMGKFEQSIESYKKALASDPANEKTYNNLANVYFSLQKYEQAIANYKKAIEVKPVYPQAYSNMAFSYLKNKQYKQALEAFNRAKDMGVVNPNVERALRAYIQK
ncbi:MAG: tetratricopeptide repeat protein [Candidatus Omnitrophica bacterium]|nr:tetratricopeptide repeat protein [Candidatus Omnitrophota bacterium]